MAGPLNLDNYEIKADESNDELLITHTPTGKTTTLSEDTFNANALDTGELSVTNGTYEDTRDFLAYVEDTDDTTALSLDTGALADWPIYSVFGYAKLASGVSNEYATGTVNNDTTTNYRWFSSDDTVTTGASAWDLVELSEYKQAPFWATFYAGTEGASSGNQRPGFRLRTATYANYSDRGSFSVNSATADSLQFETSGACTAKIRIMGVDPY
jgi:hypothetical protein